MTFAEKWDAAKEHGLVYFDAIVEDDRPLLVATTLYEDMSRDFAIHLLDRFG